MDKKVKELKTAIELEKQKIENYTKELKEKSEELKRISKLARKKCTTIIKKEVVVKDEAEFISDLFNSIPSKEEIEKNS